MFSRYVQAPIFILLVLLTLQSCTKQIAEPQLYDPFKTTGFFLDNWKSKAFLPFTYKEISEETASSTSEILVYNDIPLHKLSTYLNGNNANPFSGQMIQHPTLLKNIRDLNPGILRYPGGDISSIYFWDRTKWNPPADVPKQIYLSKAKEPTYLWFGLNNEPWTLSLENYYKVLDATHTTGMITVNYAYARYGTGKNPVNNAAHLAANWVRHDKGRTKLWEVGNESYGYWQGGWMIDTTLTKNQPQIISGGLYGSHFKIFADSMRHAAREIGVKINIGAQLVTHPVDPKVSPSEINWNNTYFQSAADDADFYIVHNYFTPFGENNTPQQVLASAEKVISEIKSALKTSFAQNGRLQKPVAMTEWNIFAMGSKQKMSNIAGVHAVL
ncbi:MAG: alpha-L-arabinofuranosidase, partial [Chryseobacterium sp.]